jgi:glc operon protein GlcG
MNSKPFSDPRRPQDHGRRLRGRGPANAWPVSIAIVDDGGHLLWLQRLDGVAPISAQIAPAKARTAAWAAAKAGSTKR